MKLTQRIFDPTGAASDYEAPKLKKDSSLVLRASGKSADSIVHELHMHKAFFNMIDNHRPRLSEEGDKICNMSLSILGPGVLSIPYALKVRLVQRAYAINHVTTVLKES